MNSRTQIPFYDEDSGVFRTNEPELKLAIHLGEDVDNPLVSFTHAENVYDDRINLLSSKLFDIKKVSRIKKMTWITTILIT